MTAALAWMKENVVDDIRRHVLHKSRLCFSGHKRTLLRARLLERLTQLGMRDLVAYRDLLRRSQEEEAILLDLLTTKETSFFRNPAQFRYLMESIVPRMEDEKGREVVRSWGMEMPVQISSVMRLRILCAGCSTGEEPYSVAMALLDSLRFPLAWDLEIYGGDLNASSLRSAAAGVYPEEKLKNVPHLFQSRYMEKVPGGAVVCEQVKRVVKFVHMNLDDLINGAGFPGTSVDFPVFDLIFCRNVMIYFPFASQQALVDALYRHLVPGGYLFTGDAEPLHLYVHEFASVPDAGCLIYRKMETMDNARAV